MDYDISPHAQAEMQRRSISEADVSAAMCSPDVRAGHGERSVRQAVVGIYLIRVVVEHWHNPPVVVTVYRTSKLAKYGAQP